MLKNLVNTVYYKTGRRWRDYGASRTKRPFTNWVEQQTKPWFAFVHYLEAHLEYEPPRDYVRRFAHDFDRCWQLRQQDQWRLCWRHQAGVDLLSDADLQAWRDLYLAEVAYTDAYLGHLIDWLRDRGDLDNTCVIVVADHGESLGEHGLLNHSYSVYETLIRVPLVIRYPAGWTAGSRVSAPVQSLDLFATCLDVAQIPIPSGNPSHSLLSAEPRPHVMAEYGTPIPPHRAALARFGITPEQIRHRERGLTTFRTDPYKLIVGTDGSAQLYHLEEDPTEQIDLASQEPERVRQLKKALAAYWADHDIDGLIGPPYQAQGVDPDVEARLQALGYLD